MAIVAVILVPAFLGASILWALRRQRMAASELAGWAYPVGAFGLAVMTGLWMLSGVGMSRWAAILIPVALGVCAIAWRLGRTAGSAAPPPAPLEGAREHGRGERVVCAIAVIGVIVAMIDRAATYNLVPILKGDEAWMYTLRAKFLWLEWLTGRTSIANEPDMAVLAQADYPLLNPLVNLWVYVASGRITHVVNRLPFQLILISTMLLSVASLRQVIRPAVLAVFVLLWIPSEAVFAFGTFESFAYGAYADVLVACGLLLAIEAWRKFAISASTGDWRMFWLGLAILVWSKHEGTLLLPCVLLGCIVHVLRDQALRRSVTGMRWEIAWCAVPACVLASTWLVNASAGFENYLLTNNPGRVPVWERALAQFTDRAWPALEFLVRDIALSAQATRLVWVPFVVLSVLRPGLAFGNRFVQQTVTVLAAAIGYYVVFIGSHYDLQWQLGCAAERVFFHLWPVLFVWTGRMSAELFPALRSAPSPRAVVGAGAR